MRGLSAVLLIAFVVSVRCETCDQCTATYTAETHASATAAPAATPNPVTPNPAPADSQTADKCKALKKYLTCLETASGAGCSLDSAKATAFSALTACSPSSLCTCQKAYWESGDDSAKCVAAKTRANCLKGNTGTGCDGKSTAADVGNTTVTILKGINTCDSASTCACEVTYFTADISSDEKKCKSAKNFLTCLKAINNKDEKSCNGSVTAASLKSDVESKIQTVFCSSAGFRAEASFILFSLLLTVCAVFTN